MDRIIAFIQNLSLDIVAGAVISSLFIAELFQVSLDIHLLLGLSIAIWLIYTIDHLLDARKIKGEAVNPRHAFHQKNQILIGALALLFFVLGIYNAFYLPASTIKLGLVLIFLSGAYLYYLNWSNTNQAKEPFAALVYSAGIFAGPISLVNTFNWVYLVLFVQFFLLAYSNLMLFPLFEKEQDGQEGMKSIAIRKGDLLTGRFIRIALLINFILIVVTATFVNSLGSSQSIVLLMTLVLLALLLWPQYFVKYQLYRILGDGIFFLPGLFLL